ncbi:hypothetical protein [Fusobacterium ulcerans]|uniref:toxin-antitoxin system YwqK family antitoxin n=1 Tax=Fusobacterium ulcerans TaxID=861 RepID=UPI0030994E45
MFKKFLLVLAALSIVGCTLSEVDISKKQKRSGIVYIVNQEKPYSGVITGKYDNGQIKIKETFKDGKYNGEQFTYYENGQIQSKASFENGVAVGTFYEYYNNGEVAYTGNFLNGKRDGDWNRYTSEKELILTEVYKDGELIDVKQYLVDTDKLKDKIKDFFN